MTLVATISADLFTIGIPLLEKVARTVAVYGGLLVLLRLGGKRDLAQLNTFDLVVLLLLSNVVQNAIIGADNSLIGGLIGAAVLVAVNAVVVRVASRTDTLENLFEGTPTTVVRDGRIDQAVVRRLGLRDSEVITALRRQGASTLAEVSEASLEPGGAIVVTLRPEAENATKGDVDRIERKLDDLLARAAGGPEGRPPT
jgi:uncharacterized membrane protein YcaP (DUF421 family)